MVILRNVTSMLEFALPEFVHLKKVISVEEIRENMGEKTGEDILGLFVDVSEEEDGGQARWQELGELQREHALSMIAICKEGNLVQMKCALETEVIQDLLLAPLEANALKRRMKIWTQNWKWINFRGCDHNVLHFLFAINMQIVAPI